MTENKQATVEQCEQGHKFAKLPDHPRKDGLSRCPHCMAIGLDAYRALEASQPQEEGKERDDDGISNMKQVIPRDIYTGLEWALQRLKHEDHCAYGMQAYHGMDCPCVCHLKQRMEYLRAALDRCATPPKAADTQEVECKACGDTKKVSDRIDGDGLRGLIDSPAPQQHSAKPE